MKAALTLGLLACGWGCWPADPDTCSNDCECRAAVNRCIDDAAARVRARAASEGNHLLDRAAVLESQKRPFLVPEDPTIDQLEICETERAAHVDAVRSFRELAHCDDAMLWYSSGR